jgi:hypothetical protein
MIIYIKDLIRKTLRSINPFDKVAGYKLNIQKPVAFGYTNKHSEKEIRKIILFTRASKRFTHVAAWSNSPFPSFLSLSIHLLKGILFASSLGQL